MIEDLFTHQPTIESHREAPLLKARLRFLEHLRGTGAARQTLKRKATNMLRLIYLLELKQPRMISGSEIEAAAQEWSRPGMFRTYTKASPQTKAEFVGDMVRWLRFMGWRDPLEHSPPHPNAGKLDAFAAWARDERGYAPSSIKNYCETADMFFRFLASNDTPLSSVSIRDVDRALMARTQQSPISRATLNNYSGRLRVFFRFAEDRGWCKPGIADAIVAPRLYSNESLPPRLTRENVLRLLATTEGTRRVDIRDRAILMLLASYGLRSGEVLRLELDDIDWEKDTLTVRRSKSSHTDKFPLSPNVGQVILNYILDVRPSHPGRTLFLTLKAPIGPISGSTLSWMVRTRLRRIGIVSGQRGPHALRHAAAQYLLDQGMSMKVVGDYLGHRNASSTSTYAKVDLNTLRQVAAVDMGGLV